MLIAPGYNFTDGVTDDGSAVHLGQFLAACVITGFAVADFDSGAHVVQVSATVPGSDQGEGSLWFDTTLNLFRVKDSTRWDCPYIGPEMTNATGARIFKGALVTAPSANHIQNAPVTTRGGVLGFLTATCETGATTILRGSGLGEILVRGPCENGSLLIVDGGLAGYARGATFSFGGPTLITGGLCIGMALGALGNTTGLITCMAWM